MHECLWACEFPGSLLVACWDLPMLSKLGVLLQVRVACGQDEALMDVQEPNRCEYVARLTTPAACKPEDVAAVQRQVAALENDVLEHTEL